MRLIKAFLVGAIGLFIFITLLSLLIPAHPKVSRTVLINASKEKVMGQVDDFANWGDWHPYFSSGPIKTSFGNTTSGKGGSLTINYNNKISQLVITKVDSNAVSFDIKQADENNISNQIFITPMQQQTRVDWVATTHLHWYPWEKFYAIFVDKLTGPGYEAALNGLKQYAESH